MAKKKPDGVGTIGERIVAARLAYGSKRSEPLTQAELAGMLGVTPGTVSQWESNTTKPAHRMWPRLAEALGAEADWLAWGLRRRKDEDFPRSQLKRNDG